MNLSYVDQGPQKEKRSRDNGKQIGGDEKKMFKIVQKRGR